MRKRFARPNQQHCYRRIPGVLVGWEHGRRACQAIRSFHIITERLFRPLNPKVGAHSGLGPASFIFGKRCTRFRIAICPSNRASCAPIQECGPALNARLCESSRSTSRCWLRFSGHYFRDSVLFHKSKYNLTATTTTLPDEGDHRVEDSNGRTHHLCFVRISLSPD